MGLGHGALLTSWYITYAILAFIQSIIITIVTSSNIFQHSNKGIIFVLFFLFGLSTMALCLLVRPCPSVAAFAPLSMHTHGKQQPCRACDVLCSSTVVYGRLGGGGGRGGRGRSHRAG